RADQVDEIDWTHYCPATKGNKFTIKAGESCKHCGERRTLCPNCGKGELTAPRQFNLMFKTFMGPVEEDAAVTYLRPETAQGIFVNFDNLLQSTRRKLPFGVAQIGKAFRNEITPGNFIFRTREVELMGIANRTDFDLKQHAKFSGKSLTYFDEERKEHLVPFVIEPSAGVDRALLAFLLDAYQEEEVRGEKRVVLRFHPELAPVKIA